MDLVVRSQTSTVPSSFAEMALRPSSVSAKGRSQGPIPFITRITWPADKSQTRKVPSLHVPTIMRLSKLMATALPWHDLMSNVQCRVPALKYQKRSFPQACPVTKNDHWEIRLIHRSRRRRSQ